MAIFADTHSHSGYSEDVEMREDTHIGYIAKAAKIMGVDILAITDHYDLDLIVSGKAEFDDASHKSEMLEQKEIAANNPDEYAELLYGIELGECHQFPKQAQDFISNHSFDFILGSLHSLYGKDDFWIWDYENLSDDELISSYKSYIDELCVMAKDFSQMFDSIGHITYPLRYYKKFGRHYAADLSHYDKAIDGLLELLISKDKPLEINTSGLRQGVGTTLPCFNIVKRYSELGGKLITIGSDAHIHTDIGANFKEVYDSLCAIGFKSAVVFRARKGYEIPLE